MSAGSVYSGQLGVWTTRVAAVRGLYTPVVIIIE